MIKSLIGALMVATLTAPTPKINTNEQTGTEQIHILQTQYSNIDLTPEEQTYQYKEYQSQAKTTFEINNGNYTLKGTQYYYTYGYPYNLSTPNTKIAYVSSGQDMTGEQFPHRPFLITVISLNNYIQMDNAEITINYDLTSTALSVNDFTGNSFRKYHKIYTSTSTSIDTLLTANNWNARNSNFYKYVDEYCTNNFYTNEWSNFYNYNTYITLDNDDIDILRIGQTYLIDLMYITTDDLSPNGAVSYNPNLPIGAILNTSNFENTWTPTPTAIKYEYIDVPNLMFTILTMPFSFVSQAFNLTLFAGTPYMINLSNLFLAILGTLIFIFLIKIIISKAG